MELRDTWICRSSFPYIGFGKLQDASIDAAEAVYNSHGRRFSVGCIPCLLYPASGASCDWEMGVLNIPYALGMELRDTGKFGIVLPPGIIVHKTDLPCLDSKKLALFPKAMLRS